MAESASLQQQQQRRQLESGMSAMQLSDGGGGGGGGSSSGSEEFYTKGPKRNDKPSKSNERLHRPTLPPNSRPAVSPALQPGQIVIGPTNYMPSPATSGSVLSPMGSQWDAVTPAQQPQQQPPEEYEDFLEELFAPKPAALDNNGGSGSIYTMPSSSAEVIITPNLKPTQPPPPPPPPPPPQLASNAFAGPSNSTAGTRGAVSEKTRRALLLRLNPQALLVDENFNTQLHNAVQHQQSYEDVDFLLSDLVRQKKLLPIINLVNLNGHTALSLCLKMRRADLIPLLLDFDAAPTQLCASLTERTNHFHYAFQKCLDDAPSIQMVKTMIHGVAQHYSSDLLGLFAKDRHRKTPIDHLNRRITQLMSPNQQDPASAELLAQLQSLKSQIDGLTQRGATPRPGC